MAKQVVKTAYTRQLVRDDGQRTVVVTNRVREYIVTTHVERLVVFQPVRSLLVVKSGPRGKRGAPGGTGTQWPSVITYNTPGIIYTLTTDPNLIEVDPTDGDITVVLPPFDEFVGETKRVLRVSDSEYMVYVHASGGIGGRDRLELAYKGEWLDLFAQESGWW